VVEIHTLEMLHMVEIHPLETLLETVQTLETYIWLKYMDWICVMVIIITMSTVVLGMNTSTLRPEFKLRTLQTFLMAWTH
jgi:hypothetical protein